MSFELPFDLEPTIAVPRFAWGEAEVPLGASFRKQRTGLSERLSTAKLRGLDPDTVELKGKVKHRFMDEVEAVVMKVLMLWGIRVCH